MKKASLPRDPNQRAKNIMELATDIKKVPIDKKNKAAVAFGQEGGIIRAHNLTDAQRKDIAIKAANARWKKS